MDALGPGGPAEVVVQKGAQLGFSEAGNNWVGYSIAHVPAPIIYIQPTDTDAKRYSKQRLAPMIETCPELARLVRPVKVRDGGNTVMEKAFPGGSLSIVGANSSNPLSSMPKRLVFGDEMDRYPGDVDKQGDPVELLRARTNTFKRNRKLYFPSTPTQHGFSRIERRYGESDQRLYFLPCPSCAHRAPLFFEPFERYLPEHHAALRPHLLLETEPAMVCKECGGIHGAEHKTRLLADGTWVPTAKGARGLRGYKISSLYSPTGWADWDDILEDYHRAKSAGTTKMKTFWNTVLGEAWQQPGESIPAAAIAERLEDYGAEVPEGVLLLTAGVDIQHNRIECEIVGWGHGDESWSVGYFILAGNPRHADVWDALDGVLDREYQHELGIAMKPRPVCIDAGDRPKRVYQFTLPREHRMVFPIVGRANRPDIPVVTPSVRRLGRHKRRRAALWIVGTDEAKGTLFDSLAVVDHGPGYCHFPTDREHYDEEHFRQLVAERRVVDENGKAAWKKMRERNEALDCRVYAMAAKEITRPNYDRLERRLQALVRREKRRKAAEEGKAEAPAKKPRRVKLRRQAGGWMSGPRRG